MLAYKASILVRMSCYCCIQCVSTPGCFCLWRYNLCCTGSTALLIVYWCHCSGNIVYEPGAVVCRVAPSWIRFGSLQLPAAQEETDLARQIADYVIRHHYSHLQGELSVLHICCCAYAGLIWWSSKSLGRGLACTLLQFKHNAPSGKQGVSIDTYLVPLSSVMSSAQLLLHFCMQSRHSATYVGVLPLAPLYVNTELR